MVYSVHFQKVELAADATQAQLFENAAYAFPLCIIMTSPEIRLHNKQ